MALLSIDDLWISFGGIAALSGVSMVVEKGKIFSIIGPNGAGKTTIFNCVIPFRNSTSNLQIRKVHH